MSASFDPSRRRPGAVPVRLAVALFMAVWALSSQNALGLTTVIDTDTMFTDLTLYEVDVLEVTGGATLTITGALQNLGTLQVDTGSLLAISGPSDNYGVVENGGTIVVSSTGSIVLHPDTPPGGGLITRCIIQNTGTIFIECGGFITGLFVGGNVVDECAADPPIKLLNPTPAEFDGFGERALPFPLLETMALELTGAVVQTVAVVDHYTLSVGRFKLEVLLDAALFPDEALTLPRTLDVMVSIGAQGYPGEANVGPDELEVNNDHKWKLIK